MSNIVNIKDLIHKIAISAGEAITINNGTISANRANGTIPGIVYQGDNITISEDGRISSTGGTETELQPATEYELGGIKVGTNLTMVESDGTSKDKLKVVDSPTFTKKTVSTDKTITSTTNINGDTITVKSITEDSGGIGTESTIIKSNGIYGTGIGNASTNLKLTSGGAIVATSSELTVKSNVTTDVSKLKLYGNSSSIGNLMFFDDTVNIAIINGESTDSVRTLKFTINKFTNSQLNPYFTISLGSTATTATITTNAILKDVDCNDTTISGTSQKLVNAKTLYSHTSDASMHVNTTSCVTSFGDVKGDVTVQIKNGLNFNTTDKKISMDDSPTFAGTVTCTDIVATTGGSLTDVDCNTQDYSSDDNTLVNTSWSRHGSRHAVLGTEHSFNNYKTPGLYWICTTISYAPPYGSATETEKAIFGFLEIKKILYQNKIKLQQSFRYISAVSENFNNIDEDTALYHRIFVDDTWYPWVGVSNTISFDDIYPIGSVYITVSSTLPSLFTENGRKWVLLGTNRSLWGVSQTDTNLDKEIAGSLPNINGYFTPSSAGDLTYSTFRGFGYTNSNEQTGPFSAELITSSQHVTSNSAMEYDGYRIRFNAASSNSIYGGAAGSSVVRPTSVGVCIWKRVDPTAYITITFVDYNNDVMETRESVCIGDTIKPPSQNTHSGLTANGWNPSNFVVDKSRTVYTSLYKYNISSKLNKNNYGTASIESNDKSVTTKTTTAVTISNNLTSDDRCKISIVPADTTINSNNKTYTIYSNYANLRWDYTNAISSKNKRIEDEFYADYFENTYTAQLIMIAGTVTNINSSTIDNNSEIISFKNITTKTHNLTSDEIFQSNKNYYTRSGAGDKRLSPYVYEKATVTPGTSVPADTYYDEIDYDLNRHRYSLSAIGSVSEDGSTKYDFRYWNTSTDTENPKIITTDLDTAVTNLSYKAFFMPQYKLSFELNGGTFTEEEFETNKYKYVDYNALLSTAKPSNDPIRVSEDPEKSYEFKNWYSDEALTTVVDYTKQMGTATKIWYARWIDGTKKANVNYVNFTGDTISSEVSQIGDIPNEVPIASSLPKITGYTVCSNIWRPVVTNPIDTANYQIEAAYSHTLALKMNVASGTLSLSYYKKETDIDLTILTSSITSGTSATVFTTRDTYIKVNAKKATTEHTNPYVFYAPLYFICKYHDTTKSDSKLYCRSEVEQVTDDYVNTYTAQLISISGSVTNLYGSSVNTTYEYCTIEDITDENDISNSQHRYKIIANGTDSGKENNINYNFRFSHWGTDLTDTENPKIITTDLDTAVTNLSYKANYIDEHKMILNIDNGVTDSTWPTGHEITNNSVYCVNKAIPYTVMPHYYTENGEEKIVDPVNTNYKFLGWYTSAAATAKFQMLTASSTTVPTLYAKWTPNSNTVYEISYVDYDDKLLHHEYVIANSTYVVINNGLSHAEMGYTSAGTGTTGWSDVPTTAITKDATIKARYKYTVVVATSSSTEGTVSGGTTTYTNVDKVTIKATPKTGYSFKQWDYKDPSGNIIEAKYTNATQEVEQKGGTYTAIFE